MSCAVDIVIINWNSRDLLRECISSINDLNLENVDAVNIYVIDNDSSDDSLQDLPKSNDPRLQLQIVKNDTNKGFGVACNQGANLGRAEYILFLNPDVRLEPNALSEPLLHLKHHSRDAVCGISLVNQKDEVSRCCARFPRPVDFYARSLGLDRLFPNIFSDYLLTKWNHLDSRNVDHVIGAFYLARRSVFEAVGGFDESYFLYFEDLDLSKRISDAGFGLYYLSSVRSFHEGGGSSKQIMARRLFLSLLGRHRYARKHFSSYHWMLLMICTLIFEPIVRLIYAITRFSIYELKTTLIATYMLWRWTLISMTTSKNYLGPR